MVLGVLTLMGELLRSELQERRLSVLVQRNFYGVLSVQDDPMSL